MTESSRNLFKFELSACFCLAVMQLLSKDKTDPREILYEWDLVLPRLHYVRIFSFSLSFQVGHYLRNRGCISWLYKILRNITVRPINMLTNYRLSYCKIGVACATGPIKICYPPPFVVRRFPVTICPFPVLGKRIWNLQNLWSKDVLL